MLAALFAGLPGARAGDIREQVRQATSRFRDIKAEAIVTYANQRELKRMGGSYARSFEFKKAQIFFRDPDMFRMEGKLGLVSIVYITAGDLRIVRIPSIHYSKKDDVGDEPGKLHSCIDVGVVTDGLWETHNVRLVGKEDTPSGVVYVLELARIGDPRRNQKLWLDEKLRLLKREKYHNEGTLKARYIYKDHKQMDDAVWVPSRTETYSDNGTLAGISELRKVKLNDGIPDSKFR